MARYTIIGGDGREYGPVSETDVRQWIAEHRLAGTSLAKGEADAEFRPLSTFQEFAAAFKPEAPPAIGGTGGPADFLERDYQLDIGGCISRGFALFRENIGVFLLAVLAYLAIEIAMSGLSNIPFAGPVFSIANFVISGALMGGLYWLFLKGVRGETVSVEDMFEGFRRAFGQLFLVVLAQGILIGLCVLPFLVLFLVKLSAAGLNLDAQSIQHDPEAARQFLKSISGILLTTLPLLLLCLIPAIYLGTCWKFSLPLVLDKGMDFWTAMKTSFKMVNKHWWQVFGLTLIIGLLNVLGLFACCVGLLFTLPIGFAALMHAYETIFGERQ